MPGFNALQSVNFVRIQVCLLSIRLSIWRLTLCYFFVSVQGLSGVTSLDAFYNLNDLFIGIQITVCCYSLIDVNGALPISWPFMRLNCTDQSSLINLQQDNAKLESVSGFSTMNILSSIGILDNDNGSSTAATTRSQVQSQMMAFSCKQQCL